MRFLHIADMHLGNQQYGSPKRFNDFGRAFLRAVDLAIQHQVAACVIAGDLFHKTAVDPLTLLQAEEGLNKLKDAGIAVIAVHGNHDKARYRDQYSWLEYLAEHKLFHLLAPRFEADSLHLETGYSYVDLDGVRFLGVPWLGSSAARVLAQVAAACEGLPWDGVRFTVLITHAGVEGQMPNISGCLTHAELQPLRKRVNYLALGHLHKPYTQDGWIYNPGALETCGFDEAHYDKGVYLVEVRDDGTHTAEHVSTAHRLFDPITFHTDPHADPDSLLAALRDHLRQASALWFPDDGQPVARLTLEGRLTFDRTQLDVEEIRRIVIDEMEQRLSNEQIDPRLVRVENRTRSLGIDDAPDEPLPREQLEQAVFEGLARSDTRYSTHAEAWGHLMRQVKRSVLEATSAPVQIYEALDRHMAALEEA